MGNECCSSSAHIGNDGEDVQNKTEPNQRDVFAVDNPEEYDKVAVDILRRELKNDPETFIINQLLMSYMFFDDYSEEIKVLAHSNSEKAQKMNSALVENHQKQFFMPDSVLESVNKRVKFEYSDGPKKGKIEALTSLRMFIIHDNVEIIDNTSGYSSIDKSCYRAVVEESKKSVGFFKVMVQDSPNKRSSNDSAYSTSSSSKYNKKKPSLQNDISSEPSTSQDTRDDSDLSTDTTDYIYSKFTAAQTPEDIYIVEKDAYTNIQQFPSKCVTSVRVKNESDSEDEDLDDDKSSRIVAKTELFQYKDYLNSTEFMKHFTNNVFPNYLGEVLEFSEEFIRKAQSIHGSIFCDTTDKNASYLMDDLSDNLVQYEVIPAISIPWPYLIAFEWPLRRRPIVLDTSEVPPIRCEWPTKKMVNDIKQLHCTIAPKGFMPKKSENLEMHLEWEVGFPKVERFLEFRMSHAQMRIFLYIILIHKKFIEPKTYKLGLLLQHIRLLMFWECESNYKDWLEDKLGKKLRTILEKLCDYLGKGVLPNYFIKNKNEFKNIPRMYLLPNQEVIYRILETPLPFLLAALNDLRYVSNRFYPEPNLGELRDILKQDSVFNLEIQANELALMKAKKTIEMKLEMEKRMTKEDKWNRKQLEIQKQAKIRKMSRQKQEEKEVKNLHKEYSSVDIDIKIRKNFKEDIARQILIITFFIKHFIKIAKKSLKLSNSDQSMFYLKQASYLATLLKDIPSEFRNAEYFQSEIKVEEERCMRKMSIDPLQMRVPTTPKRNSTFQFKLQLKDFEINMSNLSESYLAEQKASTLRMKKGTKTRPMVNVPENGDTVNNVQFVEADIHSNSDVDKEMDEGRLRKTSLDLISQEPKASSSGVKRKTKSKQKVSIADEKEFANNTADSDTDTEHMASLSKASADLISKESKTSYAGIKKKLRNKSKVSFTEKGEFAKSVNFVGANVNDNSDIIDDKVNSFELVNASESVKLEASHDNFEKIGLPYRGSINSELKNTDIDKLQLNDDTKVVTSELKDNKLKTPDFDDNIELASDSQPVKSEQKSELNKIEPHDSKFELNDKLEQSEPKDSKLKTPEINDSALDKANSIEQVSVNQSVTSEPESGKLVNSEPKDSKLEITDVNNSDIEKVNSIESVSDGKSVKFEPKDTKLGTYETQNSKPGKLESNDSKVDKLKSNNITSVKTEPKDSKLETLEDNDCESTNL